MQVWDPSPRAVSVQPSEEQMMLLQGKCHTAAAAPAVDEVGDGVVHAEGGGVQVSADLHIVSGHETDCRLVLIVEHLPLKRGAEQQHEVIWKREEKKHSEIRKVPFMSLQN